MISTTFFNLLYGTLYVILYPLRALNDATLPGDISGSITTAGVYLGNVANFFPIYTLLIIVSTVLSIEALVALYKGIKWLYQKIPFIN